MVLRYSPKNGAHIKIVPLIPVDGAAREKKLTRSQVQLLAGINEVSDDEWEVMQPHIAAELRSGIITTLDRKGRTETEDSGKQIAKNITEFPVAVAEGFVNECVNPDTLRKWHDEEPRSSVRLAIIKRMETLKIDTPGASKEKSSELEDSKDGDEDSKNSEKEKLESEESGTEESGKARKGRGRTAGKSADSGQLDSWTPEGNDAA